MDVIASMNKSIFCILFLFGFTLVYGQKQKPLNYKKFDSKLIHFGMSFGGNMADFKTTPVNDAFTKYGYTAIENEATPGGQINLLTSMKLGTPMLRLRFFPGISFQERVLRYYSLPKDPEKKTDDVNEERVNSTNLDFPLVIQFRTLRYNNFASYVTGGMQYTFDLQSSEDANQSLIDPFIKAKKSDWMAQVGVGIEFFAVYFKLGFELKYSHGFTNVLIHDFTPVSNPLKELQNRVWTFAIIFEG